MKESLKVSYAILAHGPAAAENFMSAFDYASKDLEFDRKDSIEFAEKLASRSHVGPNPPVMQFNPDNPPEKTVPDGQPQP